MRISDWSSDVCSSDLASATPQRARIGRQAPIRFQRFSELTQRQIFDRLAEKCRVWPEAAFAEHGVAAGIDGQYGAAARAVIRAIDERRGQQAFVFARSEEHTSELQSLMRISYAVFCLHKKKIK